MRVADNEAKITSFLSWWCYHSGKGSFHPFLDPALSFLTTYQSDAASSMALPFLLIENVIAKTIWVSVFLFSFLSFLFLKFLILTWKFLSFSFSSLFQFPFLFLVRLFFFSRKEKEARLGYYNIRSTILFCQ